MEKKYDRLPPVVTHLDGEVEDAPDLASVIASQAEAIKKQGEQINSLLEAVEAMTKDGANYQQGEPPSAQNDGDDDEPDPHEDIKRFDELDFRI